MKNTDSIKADLDYYEIHTSLPNHRDYLQEIIEPTQLKIDKLSLTFKNDKA